MAEESRSTFDFSDQFGSDPITRRYRPTNLVDIRGAEAGAREAAATRELAEANLAKVQAELTAQLAPMKTGVEMITTMSNLVKQRAVFKENATIGRDATVISEGLGAVKNLSDWNTLVSGNLSGMKDVDVGVRARGVGLGLFTSATDNALTPYEVDVAYSKLPAAVATEPEFKTAYDNARKMAETRENVSKNFATFNLGQPPTTPQGGVDVSGAGLNIASELGAEKRRGEARDNLRFVQNIIQSLERKAEGLGELTPNEQLELDTLRGDERSLIREVMGRSTPEGTPPPAESESPTGDVIGTSIIPAGAVAAPDQAAAASAAATGGATSTPETPVSAPTPEKSPLTLEEEARQAVQQGQQAEIRASTAPIREKRRAEANRRIEKGKRRINLRNLVEEKSRLLKAIYDDEKGQKLKRGIAPDSDIVKRVQARIAEIDTELPQK